ncbi:hypothetical protein [Nitrococcus mobilis]|uniref:Uncharacterized protein n=1 Tax=Nitrococcus mobilis Nb-231 TaxID=314278 RepID=A4BRK6_9GAMM|nr:hypothetical protein [Nitrococcus mobilis]EAR21577.1 hypothetical protein NB231_02383 [Nitrococcus mobilis Nb-231]
MTISIVTSNCQILADVYQIQVNGLPGLGGYTLIINLHCTVRSLETQTFLRHLVIRVDWGGEEQRRIGFAIPEQAQPIQISSSGQQTLEFRLALTPQQLEAIEARRNGGDFRLRIWLTGEVTQGGNIATITESGEHHIRQQDWIEALERMEYRRSLLYEVPLPDQESGAEPAADIIGKAQYHLLRGHYDECVAECRKLFETYPLSKEDEAQLGRAREKFSGGRDGKESMDIPERLILLRDAIKHATHPAHHNHGRDSYSRDQARAILAAAVAMMTCSGFAGPGHIG